MEDIRVGDDIQITAALLYAVREADQESYDHITENRCATGKVVEVSEDSLVIELAGEDAHRIEITADSELFDKLVILDKKGGAVDQFFLPFHMESQAAPPNAPAPISNEERLANKKIGIAQWFVNQMLSLKEYMIAQELRHTPDPDPPKNDWEEKVIQEGHRPVKIELSSDEELTYAVALDTIRHAMGPTRAEPKNEHGDDS